MTDPQRISEMVEYLTEGHIDAHGGYPYDHCLREAELIVAALNDGEDRAATQLEIYPVSDLVAWHKRAEAEMAAFPDEDWIEALIATMTEGTQPQ